MRATLAAMATFNEDERMIALRAFRRLEAAKRQAGHFEAPGIVTVAEFQSVWSDLGVPVAREEAGFLFAKYGATVSEKKIRMPYDVFVQTLFGSRSRLLGLTQVRPPRAPRAPAAGEPP